MDTVVPTSSAELVSRTRRQLGERFHAASAGPVPRGRGRGTVLLGTGGAVARAAAAISYALVWRGKIVDPRAGRLKNLIGPISFPAIVAAVYPDNSWYDGEPCIVLDYAKTSFVAKAVRDEIREVSPGVYLGLVFLGGKHVLDFALDFTHGRDRS
ncbi:MAG TPA: hypothetical protein VGJ44_09595 [Kribbellaceae bacterium]|jgi:hypothetical protein